MNKMKRVIVLLVILALSAAVCVSFSGCGAKTKDFEISAPVAGASDVDTTPVLTWTESKNAEWYTVELSEKEDYSAPVCSGTTENTNYVVTALLQNAQKYYLRVTAYTPTSKTEKSVSFTTQSFYDYNLGMFTITAPTYNQSGLTVNPTLTWTESENASSYKVSVYDNNTYSNLVEEAAVASGGNLSYTLQNPLEAGTQYFASIEASNGTRTRTKRVVFCTDIAGFGLTVPNDSQTLPQGEVTVEWTKGEGAEKYDVQIWVFDDSWNFIMVWEKETLTADDTSYKTKTLTAIAGGGFKFQAVVIATKGSATSTRANRFQFS